MKLLQLHGTKMLILTDQVVVSGASILTQFIVARALGIKLYGVYSVIVLVQLFLLSLQQAALSNIYQVIAPGMTKDAKKNYISGFWTTELLLLAAIALLSPILWILLLPTQPLFVFAAIVLNIVLFLLQDFLRRIFLTDGNLKAALIIDTVNNLGQITGLTLLCFSGNCSFNNVLLICGCSFVPAILIAVFILKPAVRVQELKTVYQLHKKEAAWTLSAAILQWFAGNFYIIAAGWWLGAATLGLLRLGQYVFGIMNVLLQAAENYILPVAARIPETRAMLQYLKRIQLKMVFSAAVALLLAALCAAPVQHIFFKNSAGLSSVIYGLSLLYVLVVAGYPIRIALRTLQMSNVFFKGYVLNALFGCSTAYFFIHYWSINGVLAGLVLSQVLLISYWTYVLGKKHKTLWR